MLDLGPRPVSLGPVRRQQEGDQRHAPFAGELEGRGLDLVDALVDRVVPPPREAGVPRAAVVGRVAVDAGQPGRERDVRRGGQLLQEAVGPGLRLIRRRGRRRLVRHRSASRGHGGVRPGAGRPGQRRGPDRPYPRRIRPRDRGCLCARAPASPGGRRVSAYWPLGSAWRRGRRGAFVRLRCDGGDAVMAEDGLTIPGRQRGPGQAATADDRGHAMLRGQAPGRRAGRDGAGRRGRSRRAGRAAST